MRFLIDESADARIVPFLSALGHDAIFIARSHRPGLADSEILAIARNEGRILVTDDRDFGQLVFGKHQPHAGVIYFRLRSTLFSTRLRRMRDVLEDYTESLNQFVVVADRAIRVRRLA